MSLDGCACRKSNPRPNMRPTAHLESELRRFENPNRVSPYHPALVEPLAVFTRAGLSDHDRAEGPGGRQS